MLKNIAEGTIPREKLFDFEQAALELSEMSENIFNASALFRGFLCDSVDESLRLRKEGLSAAGALGILREKISSRFPSVDIFLDYAKNAAKKADVLCGFIEDAIAEEYKKEAAESLNSDRHNPTDANPSGRYIIPQRRRRVL